MLNDQEKEELKRIIGRFVEQGRCVRPIHPDQVIQELKGSKQTGDCPEETESTEVLRRLRH